MALSKSVQNLVEMIADYMLVSKYVTALSGHAVSIGSGIPPFKLSEDELWDPQIEKYLEGFKLFKEDPEAYWKLYLNPPEYFRTRRELQEKALPNSVHTAMKELEELGVLKFLITEAADDLYTKAGLKHVAEIHGNINKMRCIKCRKRFNREDVPYIGKPPLCPVCEGFVKTDVVHFGEPIPEDVLEACNKEASKADMMVVVGSSGDIYPAAALPQVVKQRGGRMVEINQEQTPLSLSCDISLREKPGDVLPLLVRAVKERL